MLSERVPTEKQYEFLLVLGGGAAGLSIGKRKAEQFLRRGWVTAKWDPPVYQWVRITADGLRALARGVEKYGLPSLKPETMVKVCGDCERDWRPACHCGCRSYRYETRAVSESHA